MFLGSWLTQNGQLLLPLFLSLCRMCLKCLVSVTVEFSHNRISINASGAGVVTLCNGAKPRSARNPWYKPIKTLSSDIWLKEVETSLFECLVSVWMHWWLCIQIQLWKFVAITNCWKEGQFLARQFVLNWWKKQFVVSSSLCYPIFQPRLSWDCIKSSKSLLQGKLVPLFLSFSSSDKMTRIINFLLLYWLLFHKAKSLSYQNRFIFWQWQS